MMRDLPPRRQTHTSASALCSALLDENVGGKGGRPRALSEGLQRFGQTFRFQNWMGISKKGISNGNINKQEIGKRRTSMVNIGLGIEMTNLFRRNTHLIPAVI